MQTAPPERAAFCFISRVSAIPIKRAPCASGIKDAVGTWRGKVGALEKAVWHMEVNIGRSQTLTDLAARCGVSPWHLARLFHAAAGFGPMSYLRSRRLTIAAKALAEGSQEILPIALDAGYNSHEAFTRAFVGCFGLLPSAVRASHTTCNLQLMEPLNMDKTMIVDVAPPRFSERDAFRVVGLSTRCTFETNFAIPNLWMDFIPRQHEVPQSLGRTTYGVCCDVEADGHFRYVAGLESTARQIPEGMDFVDLPATRYAVFQHVGDLAELRRTVYTIWNKSLPDAGLEPTGRPDFEVYDHRFNPEKPDSIVEIWIPVA